MEEIVGSRKRGSKRAAPGSPERARRASGGEPGADAPDRGRYSVRRKSEAVLRLLRGEELDALSRELGVTAATLSSWRDAFLSAGQGGLKTRPSTPEQDESRELKTLIGELTIDNEALKALLRAHEARDPLARRRSRP
jgi:transposase